MQHWKLVATAVLATFCLSAALPLEKRFRQPLALAQLNPPRDSGHPCTCKYALCVECSLDCSNRGRSAFRRSDLCVGFTTKVDFSFNRFVDFPASWGSYIKEVNFSYNLLEAMPRYPPLNQETTKLDLSENRISHATDELRSLYSLKELYLGGNHLRSLSFLPSLCAIIRLSAPRNQLGAIDELARCVDMEDLDLSDNQIPSLPLNILHGLTKLQNLFLDSNSISLLPADTFVGLVKLKHLSLTNNTITYIPENVFSGLNNLKILLLDHNRLTTLSSHIFSELLQTNTINISNNQLESLPPHLFTGLSSLKNINLRHNRISSLSPDAFTGVTSLEVIDLGHNQLRSLPANLFKDLFTIKVLDLSNNRFIVFSGRDLSGLQTLKSLNLENNHLSTLPLFNETWPVVEKAYFGRNNIVSAGEVTLRSWLGDGDVKRIVSLEGRPPLTSPASLRWAVNDFRLSTSISEEMGCSCGAIKKGKAEIRFCLAVVCVRTTWIDAVRSTRPDNIGVNG